MMIRFILISQSGRDRSLRFLVHLSEEYHHYESHYQTCQPTYLGIHPLSQHIHSIYSTVRCLPSIQHHPCKSISRDQLIPATNHPPSLPHTILTPSPPPHLPPFTLDTHEPHSASSLPFQMSFLASVFQEPVITTLDSLTSSLLNFVSTSSMNSLQRKERKGVMERERGLSVCWEIGILARLGVDVGVDVWRVFLQDCNEVAGRLVWLRAGSGEVGYVSV